MQQGEKLDFSRRVSYERYESYRKAQAEDTSTHRTLAAYYIFHNTDT